MGAVKRVTLKDVAAACGVSRATVSFVLNEDPRQAISPATRDRVKEAAQQLGYVPHGIARALREGASRVVVFNLDRGLDGNYARSYLRGLEDELALNGHVLLVRHNAPEGGVEQQVLDAIAPRAVLTFGEAYLSGRALEDMGGGWDDGMAAHVALQIGYLVDRGHRLIAAAVPEPGGPLVEVRLRFLREVLAVQDLPAPTVLPVPRDRASALDALRGLLAGPNAPTAFAAFDDDVAMRTIAALRDGGVGVPGDAAVIGYDDTERGAYSFPTLTTVHIDAEVHGRRAGRAALGLDASDLLPAPAHVVVRESA
ncbi:LacI family DNA-binding transcriptional regulator [Streptomyces sp. NPDC056844]|uniref:LacI family DNA-binding transcriptional regulator n=1 Tax=unclassified Streptomyces TaxID=2593676 RepID=UPI0036A67107